MWFFASPLIVFGEFSLSYLNQLQGKRVFIVTDRNLEAAGLVTLVEQELPPTIEIAGKFFDVEHDPNLSTAENGARQMLHTQPDWIIAVGGGSVLDAAKAMWILYERPDIQVDSINPIDVLGLRSKARLIAIPTTTGTGSEATWATVLTDPIENRKLGLGNRECLPDIAILDPVMVQNLPHPILVDTALDALTHAIEGYTSTWHNDFCDGLCLQAVVMICDALPKVIANPMDRESKANLQNAATIAGLGFGNSMAALAHGMGHAMGGIFHTVHGKSVSLFLPYTIEYSLGSEAGSTRYRPLAYALHLPSDTEEVAGRSLASFLRSLYGSSGQPLSIEQLGIPQTAFEDGLEGLIDHALNDTQSIMGTRIPDRDDFSKLFRAAYTGQIVDF